MSELREISTIDRRIPVIATDSNPDVTKINRQWGLVTEAVRRSLITSKPARDALLQFTTTPVSESLPLQMITNERLIDPKIAGLAKRYDEELGSYLEIPPVPDEQITPDLTLTPILQTPEEASARLKRIYGDENSEFYVDSLQSKINSGVFRTGITDQERLLASKRYAFSRDVKLLALGAEILEQEDGVKPDDNGEVVLPSGIKIVVDTKQPDAITDLLSPHLWEKRSQLKDRVYEIYVNGRKYLLKEKKTARHTDTKLGGHVDGNLSSDEFQIASEFIEKGTTTEEDISVGWEKPIGFATFPDGFQFVVFEFKEGLIPDREIHLALAQEIINKREAFEEEYQRVAVQAHRYMDDPRIASFYREPVGRLGPISRLIRNRKQEPEELSFEEFAIIRAYDMRRRAHALMDRTVLQLNYTNSDLDGFSYRVSSNEEVGLEIVGFDFEYFSKIPEKDATSSLRVKEVWEAKMLSEGLNFLEWSGSGYPVTKMQRAAYLALIEQKLQENSEKI